MPTLVDPLVTLRALERTDLERWRSWVNDPEIAEFLDRLLPVTAAEHERFFERAVVGNAGAVWFAIERSGSPGYLGNVWLWDIDARHRRAEVRILIGERTAWNGGIGTAALRAITDYGFRALGLEKIYAYVMARNPRATRAFERSGYAREALLVREVRWYGQRQDVVRLAAWAASD